MRSTLREPWFGSVAVLWLTQVVSELAFSFALPFIPLYIRDLGVADVTQVGLWAGAMSGAFALVMAAIAPLWGAVADRYGRRLMILRALFGASLVIGAMSLVQSPEQLFVLRILQGAVTGVVAAISTLVSLSVPRHRIASTLGAMHAAVFTGTAIGPVVGGVFADAFGYRAAFVATGALFLFCGILVVLFVREPVREPVASGGSGAGSVRLLTPQMLALVSLMVVVKVGHVAPQPILPLFVQGLVESSGVGLGAASLGLATVVGLVTAVAGVASTVSALLVGRLSDQYGRRPTLLTCLAVAAVLSPLHALVATVGQLLVLRAAIGLALGGMVPAIQALTTDASPADRRGAAFGLLATANALGNGVGPVAGSIVAATLGVAAAFVATTPVFVVAGAVVARMRLARSP